MYVIDVSRTILSSDLQMISSIQEWCTVIEVSVPLTIPFVIPLSRDTYARAVPAVDENVPRPARRIRLS